MKRPATVSGGDETSGRAQGAVGDQLRRVLASDGFSRSPRIARFLQFIVSETLAGRDHRLKEYAIALEVFERDPSFDPKTNAVVRVQASRIRRRLQAYFLGQGRDDPIRIELPTGSYVPRFTAKADRAEGGAVPRPDGASDTPLVLPDKPSIAVLPFANLSDDPEQEFFADGLASDLITALSRIRWLFVIARNSSFIYKGSAPDIRQVGHELGVRYVVEGDVRQSGNMVRISAQLIDAMTGSHVWAKRYDHELAELFDLQDEITEEIAGAIEPAIGEVEREHAGRKPPENLDAWESYQRGLWHMRRFSHQDNAAAHGFFARAISLDPGFAPPHGARAYTHVLDVILGFTESREQSVANAVAAGRAGVAIDDKDPMSHFGLGRAFSFAGEYKSAQLELEIAVDLNPNFALAYLGLGVVHNFSGRPHEAIKPLDTAIRLSPNDPILWTMENARSGSWVDLGEYEAALRDSRQACRHPNTGYISYLGLASALANLNRLDEARAALDQAYHIKPDLSWRYFVASMPPAAIERNNNFGDGLRMAGLEVPDAGWFCESDRKTV